MTGAEGSKGGDKVTAEALRDVHGAWPPSDTLNPFSRASSSFAIRM